VKKSICIAVAIAISVSLIGVPAQAKKAGELKDGVYRDNKHDFSFTVPNGWSANIKKDKQVVRLTMEQKAPVPPYHFRGELRDYMQIPFMVVIADTTSFSVEQFVDSLLSPSYETKQMDYFLKYLKIISRPHEIMRRNQVTFQDQTAIMLEARQPYEMEVSKRDEDLPGSDRADVVNDYKYGSMFLTVRDGHIFIIHMICEYGTSEPILQMFNSLIGSLTFGAAEEPAEAPGD